MYTSEDEESIADQDDESIEIDLQEEQIRKLRLSNDTLRKQLVDFSQTLEVALNKANKQPIPEPRTEESKKSLRAIIASKEKFVVGLKKKVDTIHKQNDQLRQQLRVAYTSDRVMQMGNETKEKELRIRTLVEENRHLQAAQRSKKKRINNSSEWNSRVQVLQDELRVIKETLRKYKERNRTAEEESKRHREHVVSLTERNKELAKDLYQAGGDIKQQQSISDQEELWFKEKTKLEHSIQVLDKSNKLERSRARQAFKREEEQQKEHGKEIQQLQQVIEEREKYMRFQLLQIKKLKSGLRDFALSEAPLPEPVWSLNLQQFLLGDEISSGDLIQIPQSPITTKPLERGPRAIRTQGIISHNDKLPTKTQSPVRFHQNEVFIPEQSPEEQPKIEQVTVSSESEEAVVENLISARVVDNSESIVPNSTCSERVTENSEVVVENASQESFDENSSCSKRIAEEPTSVAESPDNFKVVEKQSAFAKPAASSKKKKKKLF